MILPLEGRADLVVLPEMFTTGFSMQPEGLAEDMNGRAVAAMKEWSRRTGANIAGSIIIGEGGNFYNRLVWACPDGSVLTYNKNHLFRMGGEHEVYTHGKTAITVELKGWRIRPCICYDLRFPVWARNTGPGYDLFVCCANWPGARQSHWDILLRARAIENQCYVIGVNRTGTDGKGIVYTGGSAVVDFGGNIITGAGASETAVINSILDMEALTRYRQSFPAWMDADKFALS